MAPRKAAAIGIAFALVASVLAVAKWRSAAAPAAAADSTVAVRITERDRVGLPAKKSVLRDRASVRALVDALGIDEHEAGACPPDYAEAPMGIVLSGTDVYARRNVYVWTAASGGDASAAASGGDASATAASGSDMLAVTVTSAGCRVGGVKDPAGLRAAVDRAKAVTE